MKTIKTDNSSLKSKIELRELILCRFDEDLRVVDACSGTRKIWSVLRDRHTIESYLPIDITGKKNSLKIDGKKFFHARNLNFNVIDIDIYGEPWEMFHRSLDSLSASTKRVCVFLTRGLVRIGGGAVISTYSNNIAGVPAHWKIPKTDAIIGAIDRICLSEPIRRGWKFELLLKDSQSSRTACYYGAIMLRDNMEIRDHTST
jgi:hypothetical protein